MRRRTRHDYPGPGSRERVREAYLAVLDADSEDDVAYHRAECRANAALEAYVARRLREALRGPRSRARRQDRPEQPTLPFRREM